ncbi:MAG: ATP-dependent helicase [Anaerolineae bacterium]
MTPASDTTFRPRPGQRQVLAYRGGRMGVAAVPGSGKTATLSYLAARLVATGGLAEDQEVLIVTLVRSAVGNFAASMARFLRDEFKLLPGLGYRVVTLHSLANDIVRGRPALAGLADDFSVLDERDSDDLLRDAASAYWRTHDDLFDPYLAPEYQSRQTIRDHHLPDLITEIASAFIRKAKDEQYDERRLRRAYEASGRHLPLLEACLSIYEAYQLGLRYRGAVDFQDLIRLALRVLGQDADYLGRLRRRYPYILEDEAQDSSALQEKILRQLVGEDGNWVRVGDPNQAIFETFTTASPEFLRHFLREEGVKACELPESGRCMPSVIDLANQLIQWAEQHPIPEVRARQPLAEPYIKPTPAGDPQPNPPDDPTRVFLSGKAYSPAEERDAVIASLKKWLADPANADKTVAVLTPINHSGAEMVRALKAAGVPYVENLKSTTGARAVVGALTILLDYLQYPDDPRRLAKVYEVWRRDTRDDLDAAAYTEQVGGLLRKLERVEDFLAPTERDWLHSGDVPDDEALHAHLEAFRAWVMNWAGALNLPIDQLILTLASSLFTIQAEIATAYNAASYLARYAELHPHSRLPDWVDELRQVALGNRKFNASSDEDDAFDPNKHTGKVAVTTIHKAKGLEWDRVHLISVSNYDFPSADSFDSFISEKWYLRDKLNLQAEALAQLDALLRDSEYVEGRASQDARYDYAAERLRLLYVGITRARRELIITWNTGSRANAQNGEARPLAALRGWWEGRTHTGGRS